MDEKGPGVITHIWMTFLGPGAAGLGEERLGQPSGDAAADLLGRAATGPASKRPSGDFFANCFGKRSEVISLPVIVEDGDSYNCFWHMPFRKSARVEIVNQSEKPINLLYYNIDWIKKDRLPKDTPYFYAQYRQEYPVAARARTTCCWIRRARATTSARSWRCGPAAPPGSAKATRRSTSTARASLRSGEPARKTTSSRRGGLKKTSTPYFGVPYFDQWGIVGGHTSAYRWHLNDPIVFNTGIKVTFEHFGWIAPDENPNIKSTSWNEREDDYSSVAFWYQTGRADLHRPRPARAASASFPSLERVIAYARDFAGRRASRRRATSRSSSSISTTARNCSTCRSSRKARGWRSRSRSRRKSRSACCST